MKVLSIVGARPNFVKLAPLHQAFQGTDWIESRIVHTGQHYDGQMSDVFFEQFGLPEPHVFLGAGSGTHTQQTARIMLRFEEVLHAEAPDLVVVVGDVNSTLACSLVAVKEHVPVAHVEAGLRSQDRSMPEEINRIVTDAVADYLFVTEPAGVENLRSEGVREERIFYVGNVMIDTLVRMLPLVEACPIRDSLQLRAGSYVLATLHRPSNVDEPDQLLKLVEIIETVSRTYPVVFPAHPRTECRLAEFGLMDRLRNTANLVYLQPLGYIEFIRLMEDAALVLTDSGGVQEETTFLKVPCITLRENTERPITITMGTNELMPVDATLVELRVRAIAAGNKTIGTVPPLWDGHTAERIVQAIGERIAPRLVSKYVIPLTLAADGAAAASA